MWNPLPRQAHRGDGGVVGPHRPVVVAHRVVAPHAGRQRAETEPAEHVVGHQSSRHDRGVLPVEETGPQRVSLVRRHRVDALAVRITRQREPVLVAEPELVDHPLAHRVGLEVAVRRGRVVVEVARQLGTRPVRGVHVGLHLDQRDGQPGQPAVREAHRVPRVLPTLVDQAGGRGALRLDEPVTGEVAVLLDPVDGVVDRGKEAGEILPGRTPAQQLARHDDEQGGDVGRPVVDVGIVDRVGARSTRSAPRGGSDPGSPRCRTPGCGPAAGPACASHRAAAGSRTAAPSTPPTASHGRRGS